MTASKINTSLNILIIFNCLSKMGSTKVQTILRKTKAKTLSEKQFIFEEILDYVHDLIKRNRENM